MRLGQRTGASFGWTALFNEKDIILDGVGLGKRTDGSFRWTAFSKRIEENILDEARPEDGYFFTFDGPS